MSYELDTRTAHPPADRPVLVWDRECGFCRRWVDRVRFRAGDRIEIAASQDCADRFPDVPPELFANAVHLIEPDGAVRAGAAALFRASALAGHGNAAWCYRRIPGFATAAELGYTFVARHRRLAGWYTRRLVGPDLLPRQHRLTRWVFLRLLGVATLCAFVSLLVQWDGLFGHAGILPAAEYMDAVRDYAAHEGWGAVDRVAHVPTLAWLSASDGALRAMLVLGVVLSLLLIADVAPGPCIAALWVLYLSIVQVGGIFLRYQWDTLLLETLLVAMFVAPWRLRPRLLGDTQPPGAGVWLVRLLCFKLMLLSAIVKLKAQDDSWTDLVALDYHFYTQPIPTWTAYYVHHLPSWMLATATVIMFGIELVLPLFVLGPRRLRLAFAAGTMFLMLAIGSTGNYGFFNLLTFAIAVMLLDDTALVRLVPRRWRDRVPDPEVAPRRPDRTVAAVVWGLAVCVLLVSALQSYRRFDRRSTFGASLLERVEPFESINSYGLFADMTTERPEIVVEGSRDGQTWETYEFRYKPTDLDERPGFTGPHMPRLDWQMWFAALRGCRHATWFHMFLLRLLQGEPAVRDLLARDPFAAEPPRYIRTTLYLYTFAPLGDDGWWRRERIGEYCPTVMLEDGQLTAAPR